MERHLVELCKKQDGFSSYFRDQFAGEESTYKKWIALFDKLGDVGSTTGPKQSGVTFGVCKLLKLGDRTQLEALAELCDRKYLDDPKLLLMARKRLSSRLAREHAAGKAEEEDVLEAAMELGRAHRWCYNREECLAQSLKAKEGFDRIYGESSKKSIEVSFQIATQTEDERARVVDLKNVYEKAESCIGPDRLTYEVANWLGNELKELKELEDAKKYYLIALEGRERLLGVNDTWTLYTVMNLGNLYEDLKDYAAALAYYERGYTGKEQALGKYHPDTLDTVMCIAFLHMEGESRRPPQRKLVPLLISNDVNARLLLRLSLILTGLKDFTKAEAYYRKALSGYESSLGPKHDDTKDCARNLAILFCWYLNDRSKVMDLLNYYPHLMCKVDDGGAFAEEHLQVLLELLGWAELGVHTSV